ncbi:MAG: thermonuclease family protein [Phycisphaerales bacterium]
MPRQPAFDVDHVTEAHVVEVLDGDSLVLLINGELRKFEIQGADAPEWVERRAVHSAESVEAKRFLVQMLEGERVAVLQAELGATDQLGRLRGYVYRLPDRTLVDLEIVRQGYGKVSTRADGAFAEVLRWYELRAKELERGVWGRPDPSQIVVPEPSRLIPDPSPQKAPREPAEEEKAGDDGWVWVTKSGSKYHRDGCQHLSNSRTKVRRDGVQDSHEPCRTCNPDS